MSTKENLYGYIQRRWRLLSILVLYVFFRPVFEGKLASHLESFESSWGSFIIWLILIYSLITLTIHHNTPLRRKIHPLCKRCPKTLVIILLGGWFYYRFIGASNYIPTSTPIPWICYMDIFLVICISLSITKHKSYKEEKKKLQSIKENYRKSCTEGEQNGYLIDQPITAKDEDLLGRRNKANALADRIFHTNTSEAAFTLGLTAPWGAGKTSFMLAMEEHLKKQHGTTIILWKFNPWLHRKAPNLTQVFFEELSNTLSPYNSDLASNFTHYVNSILAKEDNMWVQLSTLLLPQSFKAKNVGEQYESLKQEIRQLRRKIFVFIDDVDRLDSEELTELFSLVRNISSFPNMSYILAYDKEYVATQLQKEFDEHTYRYMEKIVQAEYPLAKITPEQLKEAFSKELINMSPTYNRLATHIISSIKLEDYLPTLRAIRQICNTLSSRRKELAGNVASFDWFIIELIRLRYPILYDDLTRILSEYTNTTEVHITLKFDEVKKDLSEKRQSLMVTQVDQPLHLMHLLWGQIRPAEYPQANHTHSFERYFYGTLRGIEIDEAEFQENIAKPFTSIKQYVDKKRVGMQGTDLARKIKRVKIDSKEKAETILLTMLYMTTPQDVLFFNRKEIDSMMEQLHRDLNLADKKAKVNEIFERRDIQVGVLTYLSMVTRYYLDIEKSYERLPFRLDELEAIKERLFLMYTDGEKPLKLGDCYTLWYECRTLKKDRDSYGEDIYIPVPCHPKMDKRMKEIIEQNLEQLIPYFIFPRFGPRQGRYTLLLPSPIWNLTPASSTTKSECDYFPDFIAKQGNTSSAIIQEFKEFLQEWIHSKNQHEEQGEEGPMDIKFDFQHIIPIPIRRVFYPYQKQSQPLEWDEYVKE